MKLYVRTFAILIHKNNVYMKIYYILSNLKMILEITNQLIFIKKTINIILSNLIMVFIR